MNKAIAKRILQHTIATTDDLLRSTHRVSKSASEQAAISYRRNILDILNPLSDIVFARWREHPDLKPPNKPGVSYYDPSRWVMKKGEVRRVTRVIVAAEARLEKVGNLLDATDESALKDAIARARHRADMAAFSVRQQHPAFKGRNPTEDPLIKTSHKRANHRAKKATHKSRHRT